MAPLVGEGYLASETDLDSHTRFLDDLGCHTVVGHRAHSRTMAVSGSHTGAVSHSHTVAVSDSHTEAGSDSHTGAASVTDSHTVAGLAGSHTVVGSAGCHDSSSHTCPSTWGDQAGNSWDT